jgi:hypothetical protein
MSQPEPYYQPRLGPTDEQRYGPREDDPTVEQICEHARRILNNARGTGVPMTIRCKLRLDHIEHYEYSPGVFNKHYVFNAIYDDKIEEDRRFAKASPSGQFKIQIDNPTAQAAFKIGEYYYFDAVPVPAEPAKS